MEEENKQQPPQKPLEAAKVQPKKEAVRTNLPPKPKAAPSETINYPSWWNQVPEKTKRFTEGWVQNEGTIQFDGRGVGAIRYTRTGEHHESQILRLDPPMKMDYWDESSPSGWRTKWLDKEGNEFDEPVDKTFENAATATSLENLEIEAIGPAEKAAINPVPETLETDKTGKSKAEKKADERTEVVERAKETLRQNAQRRKELLAELEKLDKEIAAKQAKKSSYLVEQETQLAGLEKELEKTWRINKWKRERLQKQISELKTSVENTTKWEEYGATHPFAFFLLNKMDTKNFKAIFETDWENASFEKIDAIMKDEADPAYHSCRPVKERDNVVEFSSNGFYLRLKNPEVIDTKVREWWYSPVATFELIRPDGNIIGEYNYNDGENSLRQLAERYHEEKKTEFERGEKKY